MRKGCGTFLNPAENHAGVFSATEFAVDDMYYPFEQTAQPQIWHRATQSLLFHLIDNMLGSKINEFKLNLNDCTIA